MVLGGSRSATMVSEVLVSPFPLCVELKSTLCDVPELGVLGACQNGLGEHFELTALFVEGDPKVYCRYSLWAGGPALGEMDSDESRFSRV